MKNFLKNNFPTFFSLLKKIRQSSPTYKARISKQIESNNQRVSDELKIMHEVFADQYVVQNGHFKGMKYISRSSGSALLPKILGSYEEPIQDWIGEIINGGKYNHILDIGCAEGYYACGFAMNMPNSNITAYDIDSNARINSNELKQINNLKNIQIKSECTHDELNSRCIKNTLVFCDIEGFEDVLLDPMKVPNLKNVDILLEAHDCFIPNITETLISRFYLTHTMRIIVNYPYRVKKYSTPNKATKDQFDYIVDERRPDFMKFIYMESIVGNL